MNVTHMSPNLGYFEDHDLKGDWPFTARHAFHLIHAQSLGRVLADRGGFYANAYQHLIPSRWLEVSGNGLRFFTNMECGG